MKLFLMLFILICKGPTCGHTAPGSVIDCGPLDAPENGQISIGNTTLSSTANYSCDAGYLLSGTPTRECLDNGNWSLTEPLCEAIDCGPLDAPENGQISIGNTTFPSTANYSCDAGYLLSGASTRECLANGNWSLTEPLCEEICDDPIHFSKRNCKTQFLFSSPDINIRCDFGRKNIKTKKDEVEITLNAQPGQQFHLRELCIQTTCVKEVIFEHDNGNFMVEPAEPSGDHHCSVLSGSNSKSTKSSKSHRKSKKSTKSTKSSKSHRKSKKSTKSSKSSKSHHHSKKGAMRHHKNKKGTKSSKSHRRGKRSGNTPEESCVKNLTFCSSLTIVFVKSERCKKMTIYKPQACGCPLVVQ